MGLFNKPVSITIYDNNATVRRMQDNLRPIIFYEKFFKKNMDAKTKALKQ